MNEDDAFRSNRNFIAAMEGIRKIKFIGEILGLRFNLNDNIFKKDRLYVEFINYSNVNYFDIIHDGDDEVVCAGSGIGNPIIELSKQAQSYYYYYFHMPCAC